MTESFLDGRVILHPGDCLDVLARLKECSIDSCVTDPPYHLTSIVKRFGGNGAAPAQFGTDGAYARASAGFMGKQWDGGDIAFRVETWAAVYRVLKPGAHLLAFSGTRTYHRMVCAIEDAGFEVRDCIQWLYGSGFPKSHDVSKAIDKRKDWSALPKLQSAIHVSRKKRGMSQSEAARAMGLIGPNEDLGGGGFMWFETGLRAPTREQWPRLKAALRMGDEFDLCFEEAEREITGEVEEWTDRSNYAITSKDGFRRDKPASELAAQWEGFGTALKPACEPIVLARKPLGTGEINVRRNVEMEIRRCGYNRNITWIEPVVASAGVKPTTKPGPKTRPEIFAENANAFKTENGETPIATSRAASAVNGMPSTGKSTSTLPNADMPNFASKSCDTMAKNAPVAESESEISLLSTTLTGAGVNTERRSDKGFTKTLKNRASPPDTESFAGIVTGLSGSMERVHIKREGNSFVWPMDLPALIPSRPLSIAANVLRWGTGAINVDGCRISTDEAITPFGSPKRSVGGIMNGTEAAREQFQQSNFGRWPANVIHDGSEEVVGAFPDRGPASDKPRNNTVDNPVNDTHPAASILGRKRATVTFGHADGGGSVARFFYTAKADSDDRLGSKHPTVKPLDLMQYLVRLVTPPRGLVLDPFAGTGTTGEAAWREGMRAVLIEREAEYQADIRRRMALVLAGPDERVRESVKARGKPVDYGPLFDTYNATDDFARSIDEAYAAVRERVANGGPTWVQKVKEEQP